MSKLDELKRVEAFRLAELLRALNREVLYKYPEIGKAYAEYMEAVEDTQRYCYERVAATWDDAE